MNEEQPTIHKPTKSRRRWFQFSLRTVLILMAVVAAALAWSTHRARQQRDAVAAIKRSRGWVGYDYYPTFDFNGSKTRYRPQPGPKWLVDFLGLDYFANVDSVSLAAKATDADLEQVAKLKAVEYLSIPDSRISDDGLRHLAGLRELSVLDLQGTPITDLGLQHLRSLQKLRNLDLESTQVTSAGLAHLGSLSNLHTLDLSRTRVSDEGLIHLVNLKRLRWLNLDYTQISDAGLKHLHHHPTLDFVEAFNTQVTDAGREAYTESLKDRERRTGPE